MSNPAGPAPCRIVVFCSGSGTNFQALIDAVGAGRIPNATIVRMFYNRKTAYAAERASKAVPPITTEYFNMIDRGFKSSKETDPAKIDEARRQYDAALAAEVLKCKPNLVVLAGWMHVFQATFLEPLEAVGVKVINLHPALPNKYDGAGAIERAFRDFEAGKLENNQTGIMVHYVIRQVDKGEPILVEPVDVKEGDTLDQLEQRIHSVEHSLIVRATAKVVDSILAAR